MEVAATIPSSCRARELESLDAARVLEDEILPIVFAKVATSDHPRLTLLGGQRGSGRSRAIGQLIDTSPAGTAVIAPDALRRFLPQSDASSSESAADRAAVVAGWLSACLRYARDRRLSVLVDAPLRSAEATHGLLDTFGSQGFDTVVAVVGVSRAESLIAVASSELRESGTGRSGVNVSAHDQELVETRSVLDAIRQNLAAGRVMVIDRNGTPVLDRTRDAGLEGAVEAFDRAVSSPMSTLQATQWLSERRRISEFVADPASRRSDMADAMVALNDLALREVIPRLNVPSASPVSRMLETRIASELAPQRRTRPRREPQIATGPVVTPPAPDRGGPSR
ncbi:zeta toxin family protein [Microbacterium sp.]|uniref:zeta toxin family protein n=1 Tax=Microbacterium sp. TaxID=51671 RepID=UPI003F730BE5